MDSIITTRLTIRPFRETDLEEAHQLLDNDIQWAGPNRSLEWRRERLQLYIGLAHWEDTGCLYGYRALELKSTGKIIGIAGFHPDYWSPEWKAIFWPRLFSEPKVFDGFNPVTDGQFGSFELGIGYALSNRQRGQGYAAEAVRALLHYACEDLRVRRVFAVTDRGNQDSVRLMLRVGMRVAANPDVQTVWPGHVGVYEHE